MKNGWKMLPSGRWTTTVNSHGGHLALHAYASGEWAITRGCMLVGTVNGKDPGEDLDDAMRLAKEEADRVVDDERAKHQGQ